MQPGEGGGDPAHMLVVGAREVCERSRGRRDPHAAVAPPVHAIHASIVHDDASIEDVVQACVPGAAQRQSRGRVVHGAVNPRS
ncbi:MAG: hypothetical protein CMP12_12990 [Zunongwangia sp.]|nr:hypothetical protein [Zunongwangia sp.]